MKQPDRSITVQGKYTTKAKAQAYADKLRKRGWDARVGEIAGLNMSTLELSQTEFIVLVYGVLPR